MPDVKFKTLIIRMLNKLRSRRDELTEHLKKR